MIDRLFNNRYEIREKLGSGGTALVYKGYDTLLGRMVTIKLLREEFISDTELVKRFHREAQAVASLSHGNIVSVYDVGHIDGLPFIVMEYVEGESLKEYIKRKGRLAVDESVKVICQILDAIQYAHEHHIVHRDIKPQNILFARDGRVKVTDFGIAVGLSDVTQTYNSSNSIMGSVHYISPEQVQGLPATEKSDIYSVGVTLYEMFTGDLPYNGDTPISVAMQHVQGEVKIPHHANPEIPVGLSYVIMRAMRKSPDVRYASAQEMKESLLSVYEGVNIVYKHDPELRKDFIRPLEDTVKVDVITPSDIVKKANGKLFVRPGDEPELIEVEAENYQPRTPRTKKKLRLSGKAMIAAVIVVLVIILAVILGNVFRVIFNDPEIAVPSVVGLDLEAAIEILTENDLKYTTVYRTDNEIESGKIISQDIQEGMLVKKNRSLELTVSQGPKEAEVPSLLGMTRANAEIALSNKNLQAEVTEEYDAMVPKGEVIEQYPPAGSLLSENSVVNFVVSLGTKQILVSMPKVTLSNYQDATAELKSKQIFISKLNYESSTEYAQGIVIRQSVAAGTEVEQGSTVELVISEGPGPSIGQATVKFDIPNDGQDHVLRIEVEDDSGTRNAYNAKHASGDKVEKIVEFNNKGRISVYLDDVFVRTQEVPE